MQKWIVGTVLTLSTLSSWHSCATDTAFAHKEYMTEMRDGANLAMSVYTPHGEGPWPVVLMRTPYNKANAERHAQRYLDAGYVFAIQGCRERYLSEGRYVPFENDMEDGYDTVEWLAKQSFCTGKIGMTGDSAPGITANLAAAAAPPHLFAAFVGVAPRSLFYESRFIGGVFKESHAGGWMRRQGVADQIPGMKKRVVMDNQWKATDLIHHRDKIRIPIYNVGGWYDIFSHGSIHNFKYLQEQGAQGARGNQKLWMGAFGHGRISGKLAYPADLGLGGVKANEEIRWFDYWLKGVDNGIMDEPPVAYFRMGSAKQGAPSSHNELMHADSWPPKSTTTKFYLQSDFGISTTKPKSLNGKTSYNHDPKNPIPTMGEANLRIEKGPMDQRYIGNRDDYLRFETMPLAEDLVITGKIDLELYVATDGLDTDFMVKLVDIYPDGYEAIVMDNPIRARYRLGREVGDQRMMTPGKPQLLNIDLWSTAIVFEKGHRIEIHISSSNFPRFEINTNTGEAAGENRIPPRVARNTIYHNSRYPSSLSLPVVSAESLIE
jgi:predicted acyl esterase